MYDDPSIPAIALPLPWAGEIVMGPGVYKAVGAIRAARHAGHSYRQGWLDAAAAVKAELDNAIANGEHGHIIRPLRRLIASLEAEAMAARG